MSFFLSAIDWVFEKVFLRFLDSSYKLCFAYFKLRKKNSTNADGQLPVNKVNYQGVMVDLTSNDVHHCCIGELPRLLNSLLVQTVDNKYLTDFGLLNGYSKCMFRVNNTRFSTFFVFSDGDRVLFHNRPDSSPSCQAVVNNKYDMFGARSFENSTISEKISNRNDFFSAKPVKVEIIPGFAFEDTDEILQDSFFMPRSTVIMIGFAVYLTKDDLDRADSINGKSKVDLFPIRNTPDVSKMTSKANLAINHLRKAF